MRNGHNTKITFCNYIFQLCDINFLVSPRPLIQFNERVLLLFACGIFCSVDICPDNVDVFFGVENVNNDGKASMTPGNRKQ